MPGPPGCDFRVGAGSWLSEQGLYTAVCCMQKILRILLLRPENQAQGGLPGNRLGFSAEAEKFPGGAARADPSGVMRRCRRLAERGLHAAPTLESHLGGPAALSLLLRCVRACWSSDLLQLHHSCASKHEDADEGSPSIESTRASSSSTHCSTAALQHHWQQQGSRGGAAYHWAIRRRTVLCTPYWTPPPA
jgi:hypothetical protein